MSTTPTQQEITKANNWFREAFSTGHLPLSFLLDGQESASLLGKWERESAESKSKSGFTEHAIAFVDKDSGLKCRFDVRVFNDFPAVEWTGHFINTTDKPSPIISDIQALDAVFINDSDADAQIHYSKGSNSALDDFEPMESVLGLNGKLELWSSNGRSSDGDQGGALPFFNLQLGDSGVIGAIGWTGGWRATFSRESLENGEVRARAGMNETHLSLLPGEEIRTPKIMLMFWDGDRRRSQNMLRQLILAHYRPTINGIPAKTPICASTWGEVKCEDQIRKAKWWKEHNIPIDYFWIDAGWHGDAPYHEYADTFGAGWYEQAGNWWPNENTYPNGLKPIGDALKEMGIGFLLWFEPERAFKETRLTAEHSEWLMGPDGDNYFFNLGIPEARKYLTDLISSIIREGGITCYRQDFNMPAPLFWKQADAPDRVGISEIRHIEGLYAFWDELRERHPYLLIDNCSSGGRRIDLEMISRSIPLWRSDYQCTTNFDPIGMQGQTQGLCPWVPLSAACCDRTDTYAGRSALGTGVVYNEICYGSKTLNDSAADWYARMAHEQLMLANYFYGDFYPLLPYTLSDNAWVSWQFDRYDLEQGVLIALRRQNSKSKSLSIRMEALEPDAVYEIRSLDNGGSSRCLGQELMEYGLEIEINDLPGSAVFIYKRVD